MAQAELAAELGITQTAVSNYGTGDPRIHAAILAGLARALHVPADELLGPTPVRGPQPAPDRRFLRRIEGLHRLSRRDQQQLLGTIDAFLSKVS